MADPRFILEPEKKCLHHNLACDKIKSKMTNPNIRNIHWTPHETYVTLHFETNILGGGWQSFYLPLPWPELEPMMDAMSQCQDYRNTLFNPDPPIG